MSSTKSDPRDVILAPVVSEKSLFAHRPATRTRSCVHPEANKTEIRQAVEKIWGVKVV